MPAGNRDIKYDSGEVSNGTEEIEKERGPSLQSGKELG